MVKLSGDGRTEEILLVALKWIEQHLYTVYHCSSIISPVFHLWFQILAMRYVFASQFLTEIT